jgi:colicin import membrane protein
MWLAIKRHPISAFLSVVLHVGLISLAIFKLSFSAQETPPIWVDLTDVKEQTAQSEESQTQERSIKRDVAQSTPIQALALDAAAIDAEILRIQQAEAAKKAQEEVRIAALKKAEADLVKTRQVEQANLARINQEKTLAEKKKQEMAEARVREEALLAEAAKNKEFVEEQARLQKLEAEAQTAAQKAEQARIAKIRATQLEQLRNEYYKQIQAKVREQWRRPLNTRADWSAQIEVTQERSGEVTGVVLRNNTGTKPFEDSVRSAVLKASPLPTAPTSDLFEPRIIFTFKADN